MSKPAIYLGLMSGTSIDSVDAVAVDFSPSTPRLLGAASHPISEELKDRILELCLPGSDSVQLFGETDHLLGILFAEAALKVMNTADIKPEQVCAIGSHGQTVRHSPPGSDNPAFSLQIGDPTIIAARTGCTVAADFRRADMAQGGQGAPLVPAFHQQLFSAPGKNRVILNLGGIANITLLAGNGQCLGFDTGPGNVLLDSWCHSQLGKPFDYNGDWGSGGKVDTKLLDQLLSHPYLAQPAPKSTGREIFNRPWLESQLAGFELSAQDIQATLMQLTATSIADQVNNLEIEIDELLVCGGGAHNDALIKLLAAAMPRTTLGTTSQLGLDPDWVEACAFAWLAKQRLENQPGNLPAVTGAKREAVLGAVYLP